MSYPHDDCWADYVKRQKSEKNFKSPKDIHTVPWRPTKDVKYDGQDITKSDFSENSEAQNVSADPPPYGTTILGYEHVNYTYGPAIAPPPVDYSTCECPPALVNPANLSSMNDEEAREALLRLVDSECCWGSRAAKKMDINDIIATSAFHYDLVTFTESRHAWVNHKPNKGNQVDSPALGAATLPWSIPCTPGALFQNGKHDFKVSHTEVVKPCHLCKTRGYNRCGKCRGRGKLKCGNCDGKGTVEETDSEGQKHTKQCKSCNKSGRKNCGKCSSRGCVICSTCDGYKSIIQYITLTVFYGNKTDDHIMERSDLPNHLIRDVSGDNLFEQTAELVEPIQNFFESEINGASRRLVTKHRTNWPSERILKQRHKIRSIPVHECHFQYKEKTGRFWTYGHQKEVYTNDYPHTCCCCACTII